LLIEGLVLIANAALYGINSVVDAVKTRPEVLQFEVEE
jgi:hypothetical protein